MKKAGRSTVVNADAPLFHFVGNSSCLQDKILMIRSFRLSVQYKNSVKICGFLSNQTDFLYCKTGKNTLYCGCKRTKNGFIYGKPKMRGKKNERSKKDFHKR